VTHDQEEAFDVADRIGILKNGQLLEVDTPQNLYRHPAHPYTASFLGLANLLPALRNSHYVHIGGFDLPAPPNTEHLEGHPVLLLCRPEDVVVSKQQLNGASIGEGVLESLSFVGTHYRASIRMQTGDTPAISAIISAHETELKEDSLVHVGFKNYHLLQDSNKN
jgi:ABC-type Fe3+/spermidine/putrescine transport system ATPase subunit